MFEYDYVCLFVYFVLSHFMEGICKGWEMGCHVHFLCWNPNQRNILFLIFSKKKSLLNNEANYNNSYAFPLPQKLITTPQVHIDQTCALPSSDKSSLNSIIL